MSMVTALLLLPLAAAASVESVLGTLGLEHHLAAFERAGVCQSDAELMDSADLREIGLPLKDRLDFLAAARKQEPIIKQDFIFQLANYTTARQKGKQLNVVVKYRYPQNVNSTTYIEYNKIRSIVLYYAEPTTDLPRDTYWELVNLALCKNISSMFNIDAVRLRCRS
jgi:hypothetical protein